MIEVATASVVTAGTAVVDAVTGAMTSAGTADPGTAVDSIGNVLSDLLGLLGGAGSAGMMVTIAGVVTLLLRLSKLPMFDSIFAKGPKWLRIALAGGLGTISGALLGIPGGLMGVLGGAIQGAVSGLGAVGAHTGLSRMTKDGAAEVALVRAIRDTLKSDDVAAAEKSKVLTAALDGALAVPDKKKRFAAMANLANGVK